MMVSRNESEELLHTAGFTKQEHPFLDAAYPAALIGAVIAVPMLMASEIKEWTVGAALLLLVTAYAGVRLATVALRGGSHILQLFFWTFAWIFLGLAPLAQLVGDDWPWPLGVPEQLLWRAALICLLSLIAYDVGLLVGRRSDTRVLRPPTRMLSAKRLKIAAILAVVACVSQIARVGPATFLQDRAARAAASADDAIGGIQQALLVSMVFVVAYLFIRVKRSGMIYGYAGTTFVLVALALFVSNPLSSSRYRFASVAAALVLAFFWPLGRGLMTATAAALLLGLTFVFPLLNAFRKENVLTISDGVLRYLRQGDYDAFQQIANTIAFVDERGVSFGYQGLGALLFFVPRQIWPAKPLDTGVIVADFRGYSFTNLSAPLQAESYINGGVALVVFFFVLFGFTTAWAERRAADAARLYSFTGLLIPLVAAYQVIVLRGSLLQSMGGFAVMLVVTWLCTSPIRKEPEMVLNSRNAGTSSTGLP